MNQESLTFSEGVSIFDIGEIIRIWLCECRRSISCSASGGTSCGSTLFQGTTSQSLAPQSFFGLSWYPFKSSLTLSTTLSILK